MERNDIIVLETFVLRPPQQKQNISFVAESFLGAYLPCVHIVLVSRRSHAHSCIALSSLCYLFVLLLYAS